MSTLLYLILNTFNRLRQWSQENRVFMQNLALLGRSLLFLAGILAVVWAGTWIFIIGGLEAGIILPTFSQLNLRYAILPIPRRGCQRGIARTAPAAPGSA